MAFYHHHWLSNIGREEIVSLRFFPPPSDGAERSLDHDSTHSDHNLSMKNDSSSDQQRKGRSEYVRYHKTTLMLIVLYLPLLVIPFSLTAVMIHRPIKLPSYIKFRSYYQAEDFDFNHRTQVIVQILNSIRAVTTIPLVGAILAHVSAIHTQRRILQSRNLKLSQTLALASRGWTEPRLVWQALNQGSMILPFGALMILICKVILTSLISTQHLLVE